ncbi:cysteine peptidase, putative [Bodo saltans]|uniref:Cysteine peptidase, putative n=1 Tax=Bodo saltans TaxID=75058 RepID=A0A0S4JFZ9_BODSA|nr:cysteine peptidase, putative [Bodo saltans]|eukprot:CUG87912.1 cysteine peptidase, putative [Bodo saltans]
MNLESLTDAVMRVTRRHSIMPSTSSATALKTALIIGSCAIHGPPPGARVATSAWHDQLNHHVARFWDRERTAVSTTPLWELDVESAHCCTPLNCKRLMRRGTPHRMVVLILLFYFFACHRR